MGKFVQLGGSKDPVGYCHYHKFTISKQQMKTKRCLEKNCTRFEKYEDHPYWVQKAEKKALAKQHRAEKKERERKDQQRMEKNRLIEAINYCHSAPLRKEDELEYCSQCKYSDKCMPGIIDAIYTYFSNYADLDFKEYCSPNMILVNKNVYEHTLEKAGFTSTK